MKASDYDYIGYTFVKLVFAIIVIIILCVALLAAYVTKEPDHYQCGIVVYETSTDITIYKHKDVKKKFAFNIQMQEMDVEFIKEMLENVECEVNVTNYAKNKK